MTIEAKTSFVNVIIKDRVAIIELNRPESLNALNLEMIYELNTKLKEISSLEDIDIVVLTGAGKAFCSGGDVKMMVNLGDKEAFYPIMDCISELVVTLYSMPKLTICAIHGAAAGLGLSLALATDYLIAEENSKIAMNFIGIGLIPDGGGQFFVEQRLGETKAKQFIWEGKTMSAQEAYELGLIEQLATGNLQELVQQKLADWLQRPVRAMVQTKTILAEKNRPSLEKVLELEKYGQYEMRQTADHKEGVRAFIEKRKPNFIGK